MIHKLGTTPRDRLRIEIIAYKMFDWFGDDPKIMNDAKLGIQIEITAVKAARTRKQEKYYRKWCGEFAKYSGVSPDDMHEIMLRETFGTKRILTKFGEYVLADKRSADADMEMFSMLIETLIRLAAFAGFIVPPPKRTE